MLFRRRRRVDEPAPTPAKTSPSEAAPRPRPATDRDRVALQRARSRARPGRRRADAARGMPLASRGRFRSRGADQRGPKAGTRGLQALAPGADTSWWQEVSLDFEQEPSGIASAVFEGGPVVVYDVAGSQRVNRRLAEKVGAKSAVFVPLVSEESVPAVLILATTKAPKVFEGDELSLLQALAAEAALALDRTRSADALAEALERERLIASIGTQGSLRARPRRRAPRGGGGDRRRGRRRPLLPAPRRTGAARCPSRPSGMRTGSSRSTRSPTGLRARTWRRASAERWPSATCARTRRSQTRSSAGSRRSSTSTTLAVLATPILVFDQMIGVIGLHRSEPGDVVGRRRPRRRGRREGARRRHPRRAAAEGEHASGSSSRRRCSRRPRSSRASCASRPCSSASSSR